MQTTIKENDVQIPESNANFEDALKMTDYGKFNYFLIIVGGFIIAAEMSGTASVGIAFEFAECDLELTTQRKGILGSIGFFGNLLCLSGWGYLADRIGRLSILRYTLIVAFILALVSVLASNFWVFLFLRFLIGCFVAPSGSIVYAYVSEFQTAQNRDKSIIYAYMVLSMVAFLMPISAYFIINQRWQIDISFVNLTLKPWRLFLVVCALPSGLSAIGLMFLPESPKYLINNDKEKEAIRVFQTMYSWNTGKCKESLSIQQNGKMRIKAESQKSKTTLWQKLSIIFGAKFIRAILITCFLQLAINAVSYGAYVWLLTITNSVMAFTNTNPGSNMLMCDIINYGNITETIKTTEFIGVSNSTTCDFTPELEMESSIIAALMEVSYFLGFFLIAVLVKLTGKFPILFILSIGCGVAGILVIYITIPLVGLVMFCIYLLVGLMFSILNASTIEIFPTHIRATAISLTLVAGKVGAITGSNLIGQLLDNYCELIFLIPCSVLIFCGFLSFFIPKIFKKENSNVF